MGGVSTDHGTVAVERVLEVPVAQAYRTFTDANERARWGAPSDTVFIYEAADFRVGGLDLIRCGPKDDPRYRVEVRYIDIVPERRVVWTETIRDGDKLLAANMTTAEFARQEQGTRLRVTVQVTSFVGATMIESTRAGNRGSLANMARYLERGRSQP